MNLFERSLEMIDELNRELQLSYFLDGGLRLDLVYECCDLSIEHGVAVKNLVVLKSDVLAIYLSYPDYISIKIYARQLHDFLSSSKSLRFFV